MADTDSSLLYRVRDRVDAASWCEFVALYEPLLLAYVRRRGLAEHDAQDVVQETFVRLVNALPTFQLDRDRGRFRTWLWQVSISALADWSKRKNRRDEAERQWQGQQRREEPESEWDALYHQRVLAFALAKVRAGARPGPGPASRSTCAGGGPPPRVGAELGLSANAVNVNASRVLDKVRKQCADYLEEVGDDPVLEEVGDATCDLPG